MVLCYSSKRKPYTIWKRSDCNPTLSHVSATHLVSKCTSDRKGDAVVPRGPFQFTLVNRGCRKHSRLLPLYFAYCLGIHFSLTQLQGALLHPHILRAGIAYNNQHALSPGQSDISGIGTRSLVTKAQGPTCWGLLEWQPPYSPLESTW